MLLCSRVGESFPRDAKGSGREWWYTDPPPPSPSTDREGWNLDKSSK